MSAIVIVQWDAAQYAPPGGDPKISYIKFGHWGFQVPKRVVHTYYGYPRP